MNKFQPGQIVREVPASHMWTKAPHLWQVQDDLTARPVSEVREAYPHMLEYQLSANAAYFEAIDPFLEAILHAQSKDKTQQ